MMSLISQKRHEVSVPLSEMASNGSPSNGTLLGSSEDDLSIVVRRSIHEIEPALWDGLNARKDLFHTHRFIGAVEDSQVEESEFWYLLMYSGGRLVATAVLTSFRVKLDLFLGPHIQRIFSSIRRVVPSFMAPRILFCGLPISLGKNALAISDSASPALVLSRLAAAMSSLGKQERIPLLSVKEFTEAELPAMDFLLDLNFLRQRSIPYASLPIRWRTFQGYLDAMRHGHRRHILKSLKKIGLQTPVIERNLDSGQNTDLPRLVLSDEKVCPPRLFFRLYGEVMKRSRAKMEILNEEFFCRLYAAMHGELEILALVQGKEVLGVALLTNDSAGMTFLLVGLDYPSRDRFDVYFNLVYGIIALAIERGCEHLDLGQTSYWLKEQVGAVCTEEYFYLRGTRRAVHVLLEVSGPILFPRTSLHFPRVFRSADHDHPGQNPLRSPEAGQPFQS